VFSDSNIEVVTPGDWLLDHVWYDITYRHHVVLTLRTCHGALLYLTQYHGIFNRFGYELELGKAARAGSEVTWQTYSLFL
jgi:hypothetical protein